MAHEHMIHVIINYLMTAGLLTAIYAVISWIRFLTDINKSKPEEHHE